MEWFLYKSGQVEGPLSQVELLAKINAGEILDDELICRKGDDQWKTLKDFRPELFVEKSGDEPPILRDWILLIEKKSADDPGTESGPFVQSGPFTTEEVRQLIQSGEAKYSDYIWKTGFSQWSRINEVDEIFGSQSLPLETAQIEASEASTPPEEKGAILENVLKQVNTGKHLDFIEQFPLAMEPAAEPLPKTEPLFTKQEASESAPTFQASSSWAEMAASTIQSSEPPFSKPKPQNKSLKARFEDAAQGQLFPWVMLSLSLAVTGLFAVWFFTKEAPIAENASMGGAPSLRKPAEEKKLVPTTRKEKPSAPSAQTTVPALIEKSVERKPSVSANIKSAPRPAVKHLEKQVARKEKAKNEKRSATVEIERLAKQFQKKAEVLDRGYSQLKDRPFEWQRFYANWKTELSQVDSDTELNGQQSPSLLRKLSFGKRRLVQRAQMMDENIINERAVSSDFEDENVPQIFRNISSQANGKN